jgi:glycosyltransferase involved in cell wall biosynthesis
LLAILSTHPIQYQVPLWQAIAKDGRVPFEVWYLSDHATRPSFDPEFKQTFAWDLDMLSGYPSRSLKTNNNHNVARFSQLRLAEPLVNQFRKSNVKALWIQGWQVAAYWQAARQAHAAGIPVWVRGESNDLAPVPFWKKPIKQIALRRLFSEISDFLYIGKANRRFYKSFGVKDEQLHPAYYCVDNERFRRQADDLRLRRAEIRREWGIPKESFCVLFAGKFIPKKRPLDLVAAVKQLRQMSSERPPHLLFTGSGELGGALRQSCNVVFDSEFNGVRISEGYMDGKRPDASFTGFLNQTEISKAYVAADSLVLPSDHRETWGLVVNEAMASGLPCLVSDACGCGEDLIDPIAPGFRFPMGDTQSLAKAIREVIKRVTPVSLLRQQVERFDLAKSVETLTELYQRNIQRDTAAITP